ncbi:MAG: ABC transporter substrate-binding protein, partial [Pseudomonadota bacterium]
MKRRDFLALTGAATLAPALPAWSLTEASAAQLINTVINDINGVIDSGKSERAMIGDFERIFARYSDTSYIAAYAMGADGRSASTA